MPVKVKKLWQKMLVLKQASQGNGPYKARKIKASWAYFLEQVAP